MQGKKIIGANCASNDAKTILLSSSTSGGTIKYQCFCSGTLNTGETKMYCSIHYWECWSRIWGILGVYKLVRIIVSWSELHENSASRGGCCRWIDIFKLQAVISSSTFGPVLYASRSVNITAEYFWATMASKFTQARTHQRCTVNWSWSAVWNWPRRRTTKSSLITQT